MTAIAQALVGALPLLLACGPPFTGVLRGRSGVIAFFTCWASLVAWQCVFCFVIPGTIGLISKDWGREAARNWVAEGPTVVALMFFGWIPSAVLMLIAFFCRELFRK